MPKLSLRQAAQQAGVSKSTISRAIQKGRLSATRNDQGGFDIDASELHRVYGDRPAQQSDNGAMGQGAPAGDAPALQAQIDGLKAQLDLMRETLDDLKSQRDGWQRQAETAQRQISDMRPRRGWFGFGRTG